MAPFLFRNVGTKNRLVDRVVSEIQNQIMQGKMPPGTMLPPERELTEQLGVSRTALREAVRMLVTKGLLETRPGVGTFVKKITSDQITEPLSMIINQTSDFNLDHLNQVRQILEVEIAEVASQEGTPADIKHLQEVLESLAQARNDTAEFNRRDTEFHLVLAEATHNPLLAILSNSIRDLTEDVRQLVQGYPNLAEEVFPDHEEIFRFVKSRDGSGARQAMLKHLEHARQIQKEFLASRKDKDS